MSLPFQVVFVKTANQIDVLVEYDYTRLKGILEADINFTLYVSSFDAEHKRKKKNKKKNNQQG